MIRDITVNVSDPFQMEYMLQLLGKFDGVKVVNLSGSNVIGLRLFPTDRDLATFGPEAALPVMEEKAMLFKQMAE